MIKPDRLKELIENNIPFWYVEDNRIAKTHLSKYWKISENKIVWYADKSLYKTFETIFETKEEAEWYLEFGNITREEKLSLPSWKEFSCETFISQMGIRYTLIKSKGNRIYLWEGTSMEKLVNEWNATKENYIDACKLCRSLFLGESYGDK